MSSRTTTTKISTTNRGRGRGGGRGRQTNHNSNYIHPNLPNEDMDEIHPYNERRRGSSTFARNGGSFQPVNRGLGNVRGNNGNIRSNRADNFGRSLSPDSSSDRIPKHAQNPFFVGELMSRFSNMLPSPSFLEDEAASPQQPEVNFNSNSVSNIHTIDTVRNTSTPRTSSTNNSNKNNSFYNQNENKSYKNKKLEVGRNGNQGKNHVKRLNEDNPPFRPQPLAGHFSGRDRESENVRMNRYDLPVNKSSASYDNCNKYHGSKQDRKADNHHLKTSTSTNNPMSPVGLTNTSLEKRKAIMKSFGFNTESVNPSSDNSQSKTESNQPQQNFHHGLIAERTSPRVKYNLQCEPRQNIVPPATSEQNKSDNSLKPVNGHPQNSSAVEAEIFNRPNSYIPANIQNANPLPGKSSAGNGMYSGIEKVESKTQPSAISETFFSQLDAIQSFRNGPGNVRHSSDNASVGKHKDRQENYENRPSQSTVNKFNPFLKPEQPTTSQDHAERSSSPKQRIQRHEPNNHSPLLQLSPYPQRMTKRDVAGRHNFSVQRPVRDVNERVPSREEALEKFQEQYEIQRAEYEAKKREKEAKKREEYLARYKHVDQGHRLNDGLLDEAAGYAPGYDQYETVEDIRQRQQEQLRQDALAYRQRQLEEKEKQKRIEEKKAREKLEKNKHIDAGYKLGHGVNRGNSRWASNTRFKNKQPKKSSHENERTDNNDFRDSISPDLLLEGETEEEAIQRQEEQLIVEMLIQDQMKAWNKLGTGEGDNFKEFEENQAQSPANSASMNPFLSARQTPNPEPESPRNVIQRQLNQSGGASSAVPKTPGSKYSKDFENNNEQTQRQMQNIVRKIQVEAPNLPTESENFATKRQSQSPQLEQLDSKVSKNSVSQAPASSQIRSRQEPLPKTPASCILKNQKGAVLVLRPTPEDLNRALASRLEVQDEADKLGYSAHYKPTPKQAPLYSNNRFERKLGFDADKPATGAIPKNTYSPVVPQPPASAAAVVLPNSETPKEEPPLDHKAELRAARLRFQQQYEAALKKKQEQKNEA